MSIQFQSRERCSKYKSYYRREDENKTGRSGVVVGRWRSKPQVLGSTPASPFSFSDVDIGDAFQIIIHMPVASCLLSLTYD